MGVIGSCILGPKSGPLDFFCDSVWLPDNGFFFGITYDLAIAFVSSCIFGISSDSCFCSAAARTLAFMAAILDWTASKFAVGFSADSAKLALFFGELVVSALFL